MFLTKIPREDSRTKKGVADFLTKTLSQGIMRGPSRGAGSNSGREAADSHDLLNHRANSSSKRPFVSIFYAYDLATPVRVRLKLSITVVNLLPSYYTS